jgi:hypothetical protein
MGILSLARQVTFILLAMTPAFAQGTPASWKHFVSIEGRFFVDMPATAAPLSLEADSVTLRGLMYRNDATLMAVTYVDSDDPATTMKTIRDNAAATSTVLRDKDMQIGGYRGMHLEFRLRYDIMPTNMVVVAAGQRVYSIRFRIIGTLDELVQGSQFFSSFGFYDTNQTCRITYPNFDVGVCVKTRQ